MGAGVEAVMGRRGGVRRGGKLKLRCGAVADLVSQSPALEVAGAAVAAVFFSPAGVAAALRRKRPILLVYSCCRLVHLFRVCVEGGGAEVGAPRRQLQFVQRGRVHVCECTCVCES